MKRTRRACRDRGGASRSCWRKPWAVGVNPGGCQPVLTHMCEGSAKLAKSAIHSIARRPKVILAVVRNLA